MQFCCIPAEGLTFDLIVAFHRGLSCSSTTDGPASNTASMPQRDDVKLVSARRWTKELH